MSSTSSPANDSTPLLRPRLQPPQSPSSLSLLLSRATRRGGGGASALVRETAARQLEERRADWGYSRPVVALDILWNSLFVVVSIVMLILTVNERPNVPVRVWVVGYAAQCVVHVVLVWVEFKRRNNGNNNNNNNNNGNNRNGDDDNSGAGEYDNGIGDDDDESEEGMRSGISGYVDRSRVKRCESLNTMISFLWWIIGFYWVLSGGQIMLRNAPRLYWLAVVFLAFDVLFAIFCVVMACLIGIAICCCLPCIIAILYAIAGQEGASDADLSILPKYKFQLCKDDNTMAFGAGKMVPIETSSGYMANERVLLPEDSECCICLSTYEDGSELHALPCNHHFHATCIAKWLKMNATCPLCKYNILKGNEQV